MDRAIVMHLDDALVLLDEPSVGGVGVVFHVVDSEHNSFLLDVIDDLDLLVALITAGESVVEDGAVEP